MHAWALTNDARIRQLFYAGVALEPPAFVLRRFGAFSSAAVGLLEAASCDFRLAPF
jgi:hypothetical protein